MCWSLYCACAGRYTVHVLHGRYTVHVLVAILCMCCMVAILCMCCMVAILCMCCMVAILCMCWSLYCACAGRYSEIVHFTPFTSYIPLQVTTPHRVLFHLFHDCDKIIWTFIFFLAVYFQCIVKHSCCYTIPIIIHLIKALNS